MTEEGKALVERIRLRRMEIPYHLYHVWLLTHDYIYRAPFWMHLR